MRNSHFDTGMGTGRGPGSRLAVLALCVVCSGAWLLAGPALEDGSGLVVARVNGEKITFAYIRESFGTRHSGHASLLAGEEIIRKVIDQAVDEQLLVQEGRLMGVPEEEGFQGAVAAYRDTVLLQSLERGLGEASRPAEEEILEAYQVLPRQIRVGLIETREAAKADMARLRLRGGDEFDAVARQMSVHRSRTHGGDLGYVTWGMLDPVTEKVSFETPVGQVSDIFEVDGAYRVLRVVEENQGEPPPIEQVRTRIGAILQARKLDALKRELLTNVRRAHPPKEDRAAIEKLIGSSAAEEPGSEAEPPDDAILMTTKTGLPVSAGYVRQRAGRAGLNIAAAWDAASTDALLIDEARRSIKVDTTMQSKIDLFVNTRIRAVVEETAIMQNVTITDEEVRAYYDENPGLFAGPVSYQARHVVLATKEEAEEVKRLLEAGADFATLARKRSVDTGTAKQGGELGWVDAKDIQAAGPVREEIFALQPGQLSDVIKTTLGYSIVQVMSIRPSLTLPFEEARHAAARRLFDGRKEAQRASFLAKLREVAEIELLEGNIAKAIVLQDKLLAERLDRSPAEEE